MAYKGYRYVEEERRRNRPEMAPPNRVKQWGGAFLALAVVARRLRTGSPVRGTPRASAIIQARSRQCGHYHPVDISWIAT
ncbi:MAG: hypothetical protein HY352_03985 [Candidatus Omnitrophica bacterium]|nr:hypothetical protein [Candidatus Omnitrophota bacterium]